MLNRTICKRIASLLLVLLLGVCSVACGPEPAITTGTTEGTAAVTTTGTLLLPPGTTETPTTEAPTTEVPTTEAPIIESLPPQIKNVILIIGDGMGLEHIAAGEMAYGKDFAFTDWQFANVKTNSFNGSGSAVETTDSAASATALATGIMTQNGYVGKDSTGRNLTTVMDYAKSKGKATGIVTTDYLHGATPAGFSAHSLNRGNAGEILTTQALSGVDFLCGAQDSTTLSYETSYTSQGYTFVSEYTQIRKALNNEKVCCAVQIEGHHANARLTLRTATSYALEFLERDEDGFCLMIEQAHVDKNSHSNLFPEMVKSVRSLANTVDLILEWMDGREDTAILITADHETGGLNVSGENTLPYVYQDNNLGTKVYYQWTTGGHTNSNVGLFIYGTTVELEKYSYYGSEYMVKNTDIIKIMKDLMKPVEQTEDPS